MGSKTRKHIVNITSAGILALSSASSAADLLTLNMNSGKITIPAGLIPDVGNETLEISKAEFIRYINLLAEELQMPTDLISKLRYIAQLSLERDDIAGEFHPEDNSIRLRDLRLDQQGLQSLLATLVHELVHLYDHGVTESEVRDFALDVVEFATAEGISSIDSLRAEYPEFYSLCVSIISGNEALGDLSDIILPLGRRVRSMSYEGLFRDRSFEEINAFYIDSDPANPNGFMSHTVVSSGGSLVNPSREISATIVENVRRNLSAHQIPPNFREWIFARINSEHTPINEMVHANNLAVLGMGGKMLGVIISLLVLYINNMPKPDNDF